MMIISGTVGTNSGLFGIGFRFLMVAVVLVSAGPLHGSYKKAGQRPETVGVYRLVSANLQELPAVVSENGSRRQEVIGGSVLLEADGTHMWRTLYRDTDRFGVDVSESSGRGNYSQQGTSIIFLSEADAPVFEGTLEGDTLTIQVDVPLVYRKIFGADEISRGSPQPFTVPPGAGPAPPPPPPTTGITSGLSLALGYVPGSFEELCDSSVLIVEAHVQSVLAPTENLRYFETDAILSVDRVLKGLESIRQVVISQKSGVLGPYRQLPNQYNLIQPGEHYILFLTEETESHLPDVVGIPRYALSGSGTGRFQVNDGAVHGKCANPSWKLKRLQTLWFDGIGRNNIKPVRERSRDEQSVTFGEETQEKANAG